MPIRERLSRVRQDSHGGGHDDDHCAKTKTTSAGERY
jgi:hypothetical protein